MLVSGIFFKLFEILSLSIFQIAWFIDYRTGLALFIYIN